MSEGGEAELRLSLEKNFDFFELSSLLVGGAGGGEAAVRLYFELSSLLVGGAEGGEAAVRL